MNRIRQTDNFPPETGLLYMAPLKGFTDHVYRNTVVRYFQGLDGAVAPFVVAPDKGKVGRARLTDLFPENNPHLPVVPQIMSRSPQGFIRLADRFFQMGYSVVNWNLGCPYPTNQKNRAAWLLPYPKKIRRFLDAVVPRIKGCLSIKTRLGLEGPGELLQLAPIFNDYPLREVILHPRTGMQHYNGTPDLEMAAKVIAIIRAPLVYNGDIGSLQDYQALKKRFPQISRWMIGRGLLVDPFLPEQIKTGRPRETGRIPILKGFHDDLWEQYQGTIRGPGHLLDRMKGLWRYWRLWFPDRAAGVERIRRARDPQQYRRAVEQLFEADL